MVKTVTILGATGSIGDATCAVIAQYPDRFSVVGMTAWRNKDKAIALAQAFAPKRLAVSPEIYTDVKDALSGTTVEVVSGTEGLNWVASEPADVIVAAITGHAGLMPTLYAIAQGTTVALANKETLVSAGTFMMGAVAKTGCTLLPIDSEHSAIFQALDTSQFHLLDRLILTASGGPFRDIPAHHLHNVTVADALRHPNWSMGKKITIDSASLMNKGLELIEGCHLFHVSQDKIDVVIHPQSIIHSMVRYVDGSIIGQMGHPDMKVPVAYALSYPERMNVQTPLLDFATLGQMTFSTPRDDVFPALTIARECQRMGQGATNVMNASNEVAVHAFLQGRIRFTDMTEVVLNTLERADLNNYMTIEESIAQDATARNVAGIAVAKVS